MASNYTIGAYIGAGGIAVADRRNAGLSVPTNPLSATTFVATKDITAMDAQLTTLNAGYYTAALLNSMTANDKVYALRQGYDTAGLP